MKRFVQLTGKVNQQPRKPAANERKTLGCSGVAANTTGHKNVSGPAERGNYLPETR